MDNRLNADKISPTSSSEHEAPPRTSSRKAFKDSTTPEASPTNSLNQTARIVSSETQSQQASHPSLPSSQSTLIPPSNPLSSLSRHSSSFFHNRDRSSPSDSTGTGHSSTIIPPNRSHTKTPSIGGLSFTNETPTQVRNSLYSEASGYSPVIEHATKVKLSDSSVHEETLTSIARKGTTDSDNSNYHSNTYDQINRSRESRHGLQELLIDLQDLRRSSSGGKVLPGESSGLPSNQRYPSVSTKSSTTDQSDVSTSPLLQPFQHVPDLRHNARLRTHNGHGRSFSAATDTSSSSAYPSSSYSSASQYPTLLPSSSKVGKSSMPLMAGSISTSDDASHHWHEENFPPTTDDVDNLIASLDKFRPKLKELQDSTKRSSMVARIPSSSTNASNDTQHSGSSEFSYTSTPVKYDFPPFPRTAASASSSRPPPQQSNAAYSWQQKEHEDLLLSPPPPASQRFDDRRDSQDSSNDSFQTAASHSGDSSTTEDMLGHFQRQEQQIKRSHRNSSSSRHLPGAADLSHSSSGNTVIAPGVAAAAGRSKARNQQQQTVTDPSLSSFGSTTSPLRVNVHSTDSARLKNAASLPVLVAGKEIEPVRRSIRASMMYPTSGSEVETDGKPDERSSSDHEEDYQKRKELETARKEKAKERSKPEESKPNLKKDNIRSVSAGEDLFDNNRSTGASKIPRKAVFSQPNIQRLLRLAEDSFDLDQIDLPADERHLLEKFVDALSKLSVEINLDDGKRIEGKRRLHNALRAIEGWI